MSEPNAARDLAGTGPAGPECSMFGCHQPLFALHHDPAAAVVYALCEEHATEVARLLDAQDARDAVEAALRGESS